MQESLIYVVGPGCGFCPEEHARATGLNQDRLRLRLDRGLGQLVKENIRSRRLSRLAALTSMNASLLPSNEYFLLLERRNDD